MFASKFPALIGTEIGDVALDAVIPDGEDVAVKLVAVAPAELAVNATSTLPPTTVADPIVGVLGVATDEFPAARLVIDPFFKLLIVIMQFPIHKQQKPLCLLMHKLI